MAGLLALLSSAYLAAVYLAADARRKGDEEMAATFRVRALASGSVAGVAAIAGALVVRSDARWIFDRLVDTPAVLSVALSLLAGAATLVLVARWRLDAARVSAAIAVAAVVGGRPSRLPRGDTEPQRWPNRVWRGAGVPRAQHAESAI
jgi:cytochrome d ubiquinol oxidase subunit II